jgi:hypothetical protein
MLALFCICPQHLCDRKPKGEFRLMLPGVPHIFPFLTATPSCPASRSVAAYDDDPLIIDDAELPDVERDAFAGRHGDRAIAVSIAART